MNSHIGNFHIIETVDRYVVYHLDSFSLFKVNKETVSCIKDFINGFDNRFVSWKNKISYEAVCNLRQKLNELSSHHTFRKKEVTSKKKSVSRITLHVTNDCNLRCKYCYAGGGNYGTKRALMTVEGADNFISFIIENFENVDHIVFFGGEPFLNVSIISYICDKLNKLYKERKISYLPKFGAITNGYFNSDHIFDVIEKYFSFITVSIDGDAYCHNLNRISYTGQGTYSVVENFVDRLCLITGLSVRYEATYTFAHKAANISRNDIRSFLQKRFGIDGVVNDEYTMEKNAVEGNESTDFLQHGCNEAFWDILPWFVWKTPAKMCPIGSDIFSISVDGDIYPCHMNTGEPKSFLGNISSKNIFNHPQEFSIHHHYTINSLKDNQECKSCWARYLCGGCSRLWFYSETEKHFNTIPFKDACEANKKHLEKAILEIVELKQNDMAWKTLVSSLKNK
ncbi:radical SAM/SPASM domain-containing protein [Prevotella pallens]|jgi:putative transcriptional regulator|uniref:radical SAM/SPASM domain-containing protein n=1 Tax=Prevotella pallens TaxID=60133 RepID=UPI001CB22589|nr:SPASM domain-containing protein [Prevotella pallens]MBF1462468.1 SPASM domain-containing protein [Prevotella pallens]